MNIELRYNEIPYIFPETQSFKKIQRIIESYPKKLPNKAKWWYRKSDFGIYFLNKIKLNASDIPANISGADWKLFRPILKNFFPTLTEKRRALANTQFLIGNLQTPSEDYYFIKYIMLDKFGGLTDKNLDDMNYKDVIMLYKYVVDGMITVRMMASHIQQNIIKKEEEEVKKQSGMTV